MKLSDPRTSDSFLWLAVVSNFFCFLWYLSNLVKFGFSFDQVDGLGVFFLINMIVLIRFRRYDRPELFGHFGTSAWVFINMLMLLLFARQFLSTFDPFYRVNDQLIFYITRGGFLITGLLTVYTLGSFQYFKVKRWLIFLAGSLSLWWMFVYVAPSVVRPFLATGSVDFSDISGIPGDRMLTFDQKNPERQLQQDATILAGISWILFFTLGFMGKRRGLRGPNNPKQVIVINENWSIKSSPEMETTVNNEGDFILHDERRTMRISIWQKDDTKMEEIFHEVKTNARENDDVNVIDEFEFIENDHMLYGYYFTGNEEESGSALHAFRGFTVVDNEFIEVLVRFHDSEGIQQVVEIWKGINYLERVKINSGYV